VFLDTARHICRVYIHGLPHTCASIVPVLGLGLPIYWGFDCFHAAQGKPDGGDDVSGDGWPTGPNCTIFMAVSWRSL
jgi:hypothetical protein